MYHAKYWTTTPTAPTGWQISLLRDLALLRFILTLNTYVTTNELTIKHLFFIMGYDVKNVCGHSKQ